MYVIKYKANKVIVVVVVVLRHSYPGYIYTVVQSSIVTVCSLTH